MVSLMVPGSSFFCKRVRTLRVIWKMIFYHIYGFLFFSYCSCEITTSHFIEMTDMTDLRVENDSSVIVSTSSVFECSIKCANSLDCESMSYHSDSHICIIYRLLISKDTARLISEDGRKSYKHCGGRCSCPTYNNYIYNETLDWCYRLVGQKMGITQAADFCRFDGARMLRITSMERQHHVNDFLSSRGIDIAWIGGHSVNSDNTFVFEDGTPLLYFNWQEQQPVSRFYIRIKKEYNNYSWQNVHGTGDRYFMCER